MHSDIKARSVSGVKWNGASMIWATLLHFAVMAALARLLSPEEFGLIGMLLIVMGLAATFIDMGVNNAIVHRQDVTNSRLSSLFWVNAFMGLLLFLLIQLLRPAIAAFFQRPDLAYYLAWAGTLFLFMPVQQIYGALLRKEMRFKVLALTEIVTMSLYFIVTVSLAASGAGVMSLIMGQLTRVAVMSLIFLFAHRSRWQPIWHFNIKEIAPYLSFGAFQVGERAVNYLYANIDKIIIGRVLGPEPLGYYTLAFQVIVFPIQKISPVITSVAFPAFSLLQTDDARIRLGYIKMLNVIAFILFPLLLGMLALAPEFTAIAFGPGWEPAVPVLRLFALTGLFWTAANPMGSVLLAKGRANISFYFNLASLAAAFIAVTMGTRWGVSGVAAGLLLIQIPLFFAIIPILNHLIGMSLTRYLNALQKPLWAALLMTGFVFLIKLLPMGPIAMPFTVSVVLGAAIYLGIMRLLDKELLWEIVTILRPSLQTRDKEP